LRCKGIAPPAACFADRHDVCVTGKAEIPTAVAQPRVEIVDGRSILGLEAQPVTRKSQWPECRFEHAKRARVLRCYGGASYERLRERKWIGHGRSITLQIGEFAAVSRAAIR